MSSQKVLLIDDNKDILTMWRMFLSKQNVDTELISSTEEFKQYQSANGLDDVGCIVCDESLQDGLGTDLFNQIRSEGSEVSFVIVSGYSPDEILAKLRDPQNLKVLKKPISLADLRSVIQEALGEGQ